MSLHAPRTLNDVLVHRASGTKAHERQYTFLDEGGDGDVSLSALGLHQRARRIAAVLQQHGAEGQRVLLLYPPGLDYVAGFFGCLYAGAIAVPAYPPDPVRLARTLPRLRAIIEDSGATVVLTTSGILSLADFVFEQAPDFRALQWLATDALPSGEEHAWREPEVGPDSLALLQYTSGSTGTPKGVMLSHANLLHNLGLIAHAFRVRDDSVGVIWLPPYHDMGLIGGILQPLYAGFPVALLSPMAFLQRPLRWLEAVSRFQGTISGGPNFAFELCARRATVEEVKALDLSAWQVAFTGAEPIRAATLGRFAEVFAPSGFRREAFYPCYGLAEGTLIVSGEEQGRVPRVHMLEEAALTRGQAVRVEADAVGARAHVGCGTTLAEQRLLIVDPESRVPCAPGHVGEIWVSGRSVARGYWRKPELSAETFQAVPAGAEDGPRYLRTGDLGLLLEDGQLIVTGRRKDLIILRGRNLYPQDVEAVVERAHPRVRPGGVAAFAVETATGEALAVVAEVARELAEAADPVTLEAVADTLRQAIARELEVQPHTLVLVPPGAVPKTSSGKLQRFACRAALVSGELAVLWRVGEALSQPAVSAPPEVVVGTAVSASTVEQLRTLPEVVVGTDVPASTVEQMRTTQVAPVSALTRKNDALAVLPVLSPEDLERALREELVSVLGAEAELQDASTPLTRLGLDSLGAADLQGRIEKRVGVHIPAAALLQDLSLKSLAESVATAGTESRFPPLKQRPAEAGVATAGTGSRFPPLKQRPAAAGAAPASFAQQRLWFLLQLDPAWTSNQLPVSLTLRGALDPAVLERTLTELVRRHEVLRATFAMHEGGLVQRVHPPSPVPLPLLDFTSHPAESRQGLLEEQAVLDARRPMDPSVGPLLRCFLLRFAPEDHVLLLVIHHLVADGGSIALLVRELAALYGAYVDGRPSPLAEPEFQYVDFAAWQRAHFTPEALGSELAWWRQTLAGAPHLLALPTDRPRPQRLSVHGARHLRLLPASLVAQLHALGRTHGATPFMCVLSALSTVLHRWSGQSDFVLGSVIAGRDVPGTRALMGDCTNFVPLRVRLPEGATVTDLLAEVKQRTLGALAHGHVPFDQVLAAVQQPGTERRELYNVGFILDDYDLPRALPVRGALTLDVSLVDNHTAELDMTFEATHRPEGLLIGCKYSADLFDAETADRLLGHLEAVVRAMVAAPSARLSTLPLMDEAERHQALHGWNPPVQAPPGGTLVEHLEAQVDRAPDAIALTFESQHLTYRELDARANQLAWHLRSLGVGPEQLVAVCLERSLDLVVALLAVLKSGGAYVPLDPAYPRERLAWMLEDTGAPVLLTHQRLMDVLPAHSARGVCLDVDLGSVTSQPVTRPPALAGPESLAYVIFTSGSTGRPKGAMNAHAGIVNRLVWMQREYGLTSADTVLQKTPFSFDVSVWEFFWPLMTGARLVLARPGGHQEPAYLVKLMARERITTAHFVPSMLRAFVEEPGLETLAHLRRVVCSGEALPPDLVLRAHARLPASVGLHNLYGPTEAAVDVTFWPCPRDTEPRRVPIGRPVANTVLYVLDAQGQPVPLGVPGELFIGGVQVGRGYWKRPELTAERFIPDAFSATPGDRLYRTGDRARWLPDGTLEYLGRSDFQVKLRGFRIEPGEIESVLGADAAVRESVVLAREDAPGDTRLVAYVVLGDAADRGDVDVASQWKAIYDEAYARDDADVDPTFDLTGWNDSYTGEPLPPEQMREWVDTTVQQLLDLKPRRVLELGCGTGLLLYRLAPRCEAYWGVDFARPALGRIERQRERMGGALDSVRLLHRSVEDFSGIEPGTFDTVVLNSVIQTFSSTEFLLTVLRGAVRALKPGGRVFLGDVRSLELLEAFHASVRLHGTSGHVATSQFEHRVQRDLLADKELVLSPAFFTTLPRFIPGISRVEVLPKHGRYDNELSRFRYEVILHVGGVADAPARGTRPEWVAGAAFTLDTLRERLDARPERLAVRCLPNARVLEHTGLVELLSSPGRPTTVAGLREALRHGPETRGVEPEDLYALGSRLGYEVRVSWAGAHRDGALDVVFARPGAAATLDLWPESADTRESLDGLASNPLRGARSAREVARIRRELAEKLPSHMVPSAFVVMASLPRTPSGKVDRSALPAPEADRLGPEAAFIASRTPMEETVARIFGELLGQTRVGVADDFFALGGHSLLATQVVTRVRAQLGVELTLRTLFDAPTVALLAERIQGLQRGAVADLPMERLPRSPESRDTREPSFAQQRLWFLEQLHPGQTAYHIPVALRLSGPLDADVLRRSCAEVVRRHEALRTTFSTRDGRPVQVVHPASWFLSGGGLSTPDGRASQIVHPASLHVSGEGLSTSDDHTSRDVLLPALSVAPSPAAVPHTGAGHPHGDSHVAPDSWPLPIEDLRGIEDTEREAALQRRMSEEAHRAFDLEHGPLLRTVLLRSASGEHVLVLSMHHLVSDGWSMGVLVREVAELYAALAEGREAALPALPVQYADYAAWERRALEGDALASQLAWWRSRLHGAPALELPTDHARPAVRTLRGATHFFTVPAGRVAALEKLGQAQGATLFMVLMAGWQALLARYSGQTDFCVGTPVAHRTRPELEGLVGFFVNTLALRANLDGDPRFDALVARVREEALGAFAHQDVPFDRLVEALGGERDLSRTPLFQALFVLQNTPMQPPALPGLRVELLRTSSGTAKFDVALSLMERGGALEGQLEYSLDLFTSDSARRLAEHFLQLLRSVSEDANLRLGELSLMSQAERQQVLVTWNDTRAEYPSDATVHQLFSAQAGRTPAVEAVRLEDRALTYRELDARSNQLARHLLSLGLGTEPRIGVCLHRSLELPVALLGILKAGGCYVPLDPTYPAQRLAFIARDAGLTAVLTHPSLVSVLPTGSWSVVCLDSGWEQLARYPMDAVQASAVTDSLAYVTYTSGSTGTPKGVAVPHRGVLRLLFGTRFARFGPDEVILQVTPLTFDPHTLELWGGLLHGARLVFSPPHTPDVAELARLITEHRVTWMVLATALFDLMQQHQPEALARVTQLVVGGEVIPTSRVRERLAAGSSVVNAYGPTESTTITTALRLSPGDVVGTSVSIGGPIANTQVYVLDAALRPVPVGVPGELFIGGDGLARGYLGRPALTAERFLPHPFSSVPGARLYRSGDRVRWRQDGTLEFLGRLDFQVKVRGFRIELGEIEAVLRAHPAVSEAVVVVREDSVRDSRRVADGAPDTRGAREDVAGGRRLVAYVTPETVDTAGLRESLREQLPEYMVPSAFVALAALPLSSHGKVDREALPAPEAPRVTADFAEPRSPREQQVAALFREVLQVERVGLHDDFFVLGGHSLLATQVVTRLRARLGVELPLRTLFEAPTVSQLVKHFEALLPHGVRTDMPPLLPVARGEALPLSFAQQRLWFLEQLQPGRAVYNVPVALKLSGPLDVEALRSAFAEVVRRHEVLRTTFATRDDQPVQRVHPAPAHRALPVEDLRALDAAARDTALRRRMADEAHHPFDLATGPLLRTVLVRTEETEHVLLLCMHHLVSDGWSMGVLVREVAALYAAHQEGQPASLPELPVQYADFATWQRQWVQSEGLQAQVEALKARLQEVPALELPAESGRPATPTLRGASHFFTLPAELVHGLEQVGREQGATLFMVTLAAYEALLARYSGQDDFAVGSPIAHRTRAELEPLIGFFVNTLVLRTRLEGDPTFAELVDRVRESALAAYANQDVPFDRLVEALGGERTEGRAPLFQVMFALQNAPMQPPSLPGLQVDLLRSVTDIARFDLSLSLMERGGILEGTLEYSLDLLSPASAERLARHYRVLLEAVVRDAQVRVSRLPLMDAAEHHQVLVAWNTTHTGAHFADSIPSLFAAQVRRSPGAVAVEHEGRTLTYGALDARSNQLARHLRSLGLTPEARVGLCMERGPELVVGMLGILKAGGCYVPLDPAYPRQRLAFMLQDAGVACVVAQAPTVSSLPEHGRPMVCLDSDAAVLSRHPETALSGVSVSPGQLAYVIYTSGSTGTPKGAGVEHRSVASLVRDTNYVRLTPDDCIAQVATPSFDAATFEVWGALLNGARLAIISRDVTLSPPRFAQALRDVGATTVFLTTVLFNELVRECPGALGPLRNVLFGGDSADPRVVRAMVDAGFRGRLLNCYGPTEATVFSTFHPTAGLAADAVSVPIGGPLARVRLYVLDTHGEPVPPGVHGELFIGGEGVGRGYPGHPALTAERFVPDPFSDTPGARLYRTGDRVRWRTDGTLDFAGRMDLQVKVRGFRIEPGEVESALRAHPSVHEAVVVVREEAPGDKRLVAYVTGTSSPDAATLRSFLTERLPAHLVPSAFVAITAFPLTPSGKLDREALPAPSAGLATAEAPRVPERLTPFQQRVAALFRKLLHVEHVGLHDDFFALGGHSLLATQLVSRVRSTFQVELPLRALFVAPTVAGVTECVEEQFLGRLPEPKTPPPRPVPRDGALPLSFAQQRLWVLDQLQPGSSHYNVAGALRMEGVLDIEALRRALEHLVSRHEALRTTFAMKECQPVQVLHPHTGWPLPVTDLEAELRETDALRLATDQVKHPFPAMTREAEALSLGSEQASQSFPAMTREAEALSLATEEASESFAVMTRAAEAQRLATEEASHPFAAKTREAEALRLATEEASRPFDLGTGPLLRTRLLRLSAEHHVLVLVMHHIISDGWSIGVMVREVVAGYEAFASGKAPMLPSLPVQYADFAAWQRQWLQGDVLAREVDWWKAQLAGAPQVLDLPTDKPRPAVRTPRGALLPAHLPHELMVGLLSLARQEGTTPFMALLAAWQVLLSRYSRQEDVLVGSPIAGRRHGELEGLVGFFVNTLVLRARVRPEDSFRALLGQVRGTTLAAFEHQDLPFEKLVEELNVPRDVSRNPLVQVVFALQNAPAGELRAPGLTLRPLEVDNATARFDLGLLLTETADGLRGVIEYSTDLFEASTVARLVGHLRTLLEAAVATPDRPLATLPLLSSGERQQLLVEWNDTSRPYPAVTIPEAFSRQAALRPDAIALEYGEQRITYRQLEVRANRLAHLLRSRGVGRDSLVAVSLERGVELIVSLLGILKAGGAYVPLDAAYPAQRVALMLEDAKPQLMLTSRALREQLHLPETSPPCLFVEELTLESQPETPPASGSGPRDLAYVIFTSGSTGRPKGVAIEHRGVLRLVHSEPYAGFGMREPGLLLAPISFDGSVMEMWIPLLHGSRLVIFPARAVPSDLDTLGHVVERHGVTLMHLPAGLFSQLAEHRPDILGRLRAVHPVGDVLSVPHARDVLESLRLPVTNGYGPTETSIIALRFTMERPEEVGTSVAIGTPIANTRAYVLDAHLQPVPVGVPGELFLGGDGVARGYVSRPDLTAERFIPDPFSTTPGERLYRTGDLVRWRPDGALEFLGRLDFQVKVRGFRIELPEVEAALRALPAVHEAAVVVREDVPGDKRLVAYAMPREGQSLDTATLRAELRQRLPEYMVPSFFVTLPALPLNPSGKVDRKALPVPDAVSTGRQGRFVEPTHPLEQQLAALYARELGTERVGVHDHLFEELGGTSLSVVRIATRLREELKRELPVVWLFEHPTIHDLARRLEREAGQAPRAQQPEPRPSASVPTSRSSGAVAIIGMAGRFPGAGSVREFWRNLREGLESISRFSAEELEHLPGLPDGLELWQHPDFVPAGGVLDGIDRFDPAFFDMSLREAQWMDPQQRLFLQCAWTALEDAGLDPDRFPGAISLYAGATDSGYTDLVRATVPWDGAALFELFGTATHESLATKTSYKLGLTGESLLVYTACSTGLVAVHLACQSLLAGLSDVALAGAARITVPQRTGYVHQEGMIFSPDGHCRAFDARAQGTIAGNGVASVVMKRLEDAERDGDSIYAVIRATATNNDGRNKSGFTAPSVQGQAAVVTQALARAGVEPKDIGYVETHGTATPLGDPIEVAALQRAYGLGAEHRGTIALASLKTNVGHLDTVAGLAGLIKVALSLHHAELPPSLHFERPNPRIDFESGPFFVNTALRKWPRGKAPRRAAVSSFGVGGTNAHAVLEESPMSHSGSSTRTHQLVTLSARSPEALEAACQQLAMHAEASAADLSLADVAYTHAVGRKAFEYRRAVVAQDAADLAKQLRKPYTAVRVKAEAARGRRVALVFPGQGAQQVGMGRELYVAEPAFRAHVDACLALLEAPLRTRVRALLQGQQDAEAAALPQEPLRARVGASRQGSRMRSRPR